MPAQPAPVSVHCQQPHKPLTWSQMEPHSNPIQPLMALPRGSGWRLFRFATWEMGRTAPQPTSSEHTKDKMHTEFRPGRLPALSRAPTLILRYNTRWDELALIVRVAHAGVRADCWVMSPSRMDRGGPGFGEARGPPFLFMNAEGPAVLGLFHFLQVQVPKRSKLEAAFG